MSLLRFHVDLYGIQAIPHRSTRNIWGTVKTFFPPPTLQSIHAITPYPIEHHQITLVMMMMAKMVVVAEVAEMMVVMIMMVLLATTHLIMTPLMMIPLEEAIHLIRRHNSYALWKPFSITLKEKAKV